ncbi:hypothetical protein MUP32_06380 [Candidatus Microgenomates bacterium]|nr:hypothetical protein [Candidatus Microgenomates bacterium]
MLITRPNHDPTTNYLCRWSEKIINQAGKSKQKIIDLKGRRAKAKEFLSIVKKTNPSFVVLNGHGAEDRIAGYNNEVLVQSGRNESIFSGRIIFARSCRSAKILGKSAVASGTRVYIGYDDDFVFFINETKTTRPLEDNTAKLFLEPSNYIAIALLKGHNAFEADTRSKEMYKNNIQKLMTSETPKEDKDLIAFLRWDMINQVCLGNGEDKL